MDSTSTASDTRMNPPPVVLAVGRNYPHPGGPPRPDHPVVFCKNPMAVISSGDPIVIPQVCATHGMVDFEAELAVELGVSVKDADVATARAAIARCMPANDVTCRWWEQYGSEGQLCRGKSFDSFCPIGPGVDAANISLDEPRRIVSRLNGHIMQDACISEMYRGVIDLIVDLSRGVTLMAGTILLTGTPYGIGLQQSPPRYLRAGDVIEVDIEGIGVVSNHVLG